MLVKRLMMRQSQSQCRRQVLQQRHLVLGIGSERIHMTVDITAGGIEILLAPVGTEDGGRVRCQSQDGFQLSLHHALLLRLHVVANGIGLRGHIILLAITETVHHEIGLNRVLGRKLIDSAHVPSQSFVSHLVVGTASDIAACFWAIGYLI